MKATGNIITIIRNKFTGERGQIAVIAAISLIVLIAMMGFVVDVGALYSEKAKLQNAMDAASLAGAQDLPDTSKATTTANQYIQLNGYNPSDFTITFSDSNHVISISGTKNVGFTFMRVLGFQSSGVYSTADARKVEISGAFDFTLFSGSTSTTLILNGTNQYVGGSSHTNQNFIANGTNITITGACEAMGTLTINGTGININNRYPHADFVDMPDFSETIRLQAEAAGTLYIGNKTYNGSSIVVDHPIYVQGNVIVNGSSFVGKGCILATGNITFNGSNLNASTSDAVCFYSKNGYIIVNGSGVSLDGILYAPNGSITMNGSSQTVHGRIIGKTLIINGSSLTFQSGPNDLKSLPSSIQLIK
jgi:Flp pilus assembly protein TadG